MMTNVDWIFDIFGKASDFLYQYAFFFIHEYVACHCLFESHLLHSSFHFLFYHFIYNALKLFFACERRKLSANNILHFAVSLYSTIVSVIVQRTSC